MGLISEMGTPPFGGNTPSGFENGSSGLITLVVAGLVLDEGCVTFMSTSLIRNVSL